MNGVLIPLSFPLCLRILLNALCSYIYFLWAISEMREYFGLFFARKIRFTLGSEEMNNIARVNIFIVWETSKNCDCRSKCVDCVVGITWKTYPFVLIELNQENASSLGRRDGVIWIITQAISSWWRNRTLKSFLDEFEQMFEKIESSLRFCCLWLENILTL